MEYANSHTEEGDIPLSPKMPVPVQSLADLQDRCNQLLSEIETFVNHLRAQRPTGHINPEMRPFRTGVQSELKSINRLAKAAPDEADQERLSHALRSSNVPFFEALWSTAKRSQGVIAFGKRFYWKQPTKETKQASKADLTGSMENGGTNTKAHRMKDSALVDIVSENGLRWIKVSTLTETRLGFEIAKQGWERDDSDDETYGSRPGSSMGDYKDEDDDGLSILKISEDLVKASKCCRVRYRHPKITLVLPKISRNRIEQVTQLIGDIEKMGIEVQALEDIPTMASPNINKALQTMTIDESSYMTQTLNVDCTLLLALVSDLSHYEINQESWFHTATRRQIEVEEKESLLPSVLYPVMVNRRLTCTAEAARRMQEIVETIATPSERRRAELLIDVSCDLARADEIRKEWASLSIYPVSNALQLPIITVNETSLDSWSRKLPNFANPVSEQLSELNRSVFLYGWKEGITTITSNRTVARQIETIIEEHRQPDEDDCEGPDLWLCSVARSLIGKEKGRK